MKPATQYLAFDVHQATTTAVVRDGTGRIRMRAVLETSARAILDFVCGLRGEVWVAFEEGTQAQWLHDLLTPHVARVIVCDVRQTRSLKGNKTTGSTRTGSRRCSGWGHCGRSSTAARRC